ncbi:hypothetical protein H0H93_005797 [Arthromyces matolae]|nr:hypothetical protein H0H93_005797 [Arthromyces matolae]
MLKGPYDEPIDKVANGALHNQTEPEVEDDDIFGTRQTGATDAPQVPVNGTSEEQDEEEEEEEEVDLGDESDEDVSAIQSLSGQNLTCHSYEVEIIMEAAPRSLDFRQNRGPTQRIPSSSVPAQYKAGTQSLLTTEYTPISRGGPPETVAQATIPTQSQLQPQTVSHTAPIAQPSEPSVQPQDDGIDPNTLPPVEAPPSHPTIDPTATGILDGRSILEVDLAAMVDKPWRRPGSDISDWFNYGFDEISWETYCYRRRDLGELANVLKTNVINFAGMQEEQLTALPPEVRQMVMTGASAMMNGAANTGMMAPGVMMDMSGMMPMGMDMGMGMGGGMMQMQPDGTAQMPQGVANGTPEQAAQGNVGMMQDAAFPGQQAGDMMAIGMGNEYALQQQAQMGQPMYQAMDGPQPVVAPSPVPAGRGAAPAPYRGRAQGMIRGRGFIGRGRGRGGFGDGGGGAPPPAPVRPASPLPPGVPTGPRNQNKYKDRDGNAPAVDGLDYGGTNLGRIPSGEPDERTTENGGARQG